jgi:hypothetical protein
LAFHSPTLPECPGRWPESLQVAIRQPRRPLNREALDIRRRLPAIFMVVKRRSCGLRLPLMARL